jgi:hypothetical protein
VPRRFTDLTDPGWTVLFENLQSSWFRLETLQVYDVGYEAAEYDEFLRTGQFHRPDDSWQQMIAAHVRAGRQLQRVHVVEEPLTDYLRYELAAYGVNSAAGEEIRLLPVAASDWPTNLPRGEDFWLFDDVAAFAMRYDEAGRFLAAEEVTGPKTLAEYRRRRDAALATSISLADYIRRAA